MMFPEPEWDKVAWLTPRHMEAWDLLPWAGGSPKTGRPARDKKRRKVQRAARRFNRKKK